MILSAPQGQFLSSLRSLVTSESIDGPVTLDRVHEIATTLKDLYPLNPLEVGQVIHELSASMTIMQATDLEIVDPTNHKRWLQERKASTKTSHWDAYRALLENRHRPEGVIKALDQQTDAVVELLGDPTDETKWTRTRSGLLMGDVQSGKTATYIGVINKAIDYGFRVFVLIAGHTDDLRRQTQERVDEDVIGYNTSFDEINIVRTTSYQNRKIGIGTVLDLNKNGADVEVLAMTGVGSATGSNGDFRADSVNALRFPISRKLTNEHALVFVIKKNYKVLENVTNFITRNGQLDVPLVVIDDESDWGSPNTNVAEADPTEINHRIRELLKASSKSSYLAITATPFANVFIDHDIEDDLFPRDYIRSLSAPSNYLGADSYFGEEEDSRISIDIKDCLELLPLNHKKNHPVLELPLSLKEAIITFLIGTALKVGAGAGSADNSSMLVNVSRFKIVQGKVERLIAMFLRELKQVAETELQRNIAPDIMSDLANEIVRVGEKKYRESFNWASVKPELLEVIENVESQLVNSDTTKERLMKSRQAAITHEESSSVIPIIYVGGDVLSRGLTLKGLLVSYFVRQPAAADTLLQMARWFGYRDGYDHLVRIWLPFVTRERFRLTATTVAEFRENLEEMKYLGLKPTEFGLSLRQIPGFAIVAANKRRATENYDATLNTNGKVFHTQLLDWSSSSRNQNHQAVNSLLKKLSTLPTSSTGLWHGVSDSIITKFLETYVSHSDDPFFGQPAAGMPSPILKFLYTNEELPAWRVKFISGKGKEFEHSSLGKIHSTKRNNLEPHMQADSQISHFQIANRTLQSPGDSASALTNDEQLLAEKSRQELGKKTIDDAVARSVLREPTLFLYLITAEPTESSHENLPTISVDDQLWGLRVAFPGQPGTGATNNSSNTLIVNSVFLRQLLSSPESEVPLEDGDE